MDGAADDDDNVSFGFEEFSAESPDIFFNFVSLFISSIALSPSLSALFANTACGGALTSFGLGVAPLPHLTLCPAS